MSCERCNTAQELRGPELGKHYYVRVDNGNVELVGCDEHVKEVVEMIRAYPKIVQELSKPDTSC